MSITIRAVKTIEESRMVVDLALRVWGGKPLDVMPDHMLITVAKNGGVVLLACDGDEPVGFVFGFLGFTDQLLLKHCSHEAAVLPKYQNRGLGYQLKAAQRQMLLKQGLDHATWTFDPLETRNANLNLHKLGGVSSTYLRNVYGEMDDGLNAGLPTDRFLVDWWVASEWVRSRIDEKVFLPSLSEWLEQGIKVLNAPTRNRDGHLVPIIPRSSGDAFEDRYYLLEFPTNIQAIKQTDLGLAYAWRMHSQAIFELAFARGYHAVDLLYQNGRSCYLLERNFTQRR